MPEELPATMAEADAALTTSDPETAPTDVAEEPAAEPEGQARDEQGRFTAETPKDEPEASAEEQASPETPVEPTEAATDEEAVEEPDDPVVYRADNQEFAIPGSAVGEDGWFIPTASIPEVQQLLAAG